MSVGTPTSNELAAGCRPSRLTLALDAEPESDLDHPLLRTSPGENRPASDHSPKAASAAASRGERQLDRLATPTISNLNHARCTTAGRFGSRGPKLGGHDLGAAASERRVPACPSASLQPWCGACTWSWPGL